LPLDPEASQFLENMAARRGAPAHTQSPAALRERSKKMGSPPGPDVHSVTDATVPGPESDVAVRIYRPDDRDGHPIVLMIHGGGFTFGSIDSVDGIARRTCEALPAVVVSIDYRLAPEDPYPAAVADCYAVLDWVANHAAEIGGDSARIAVTGESSGGNLAAAVALMARDRGGPHLAFQLLVVPLLDNDFSRPSWSDNAAYPPTQADMAFYFQNYLGGESSPGPYALPALVEDLSGLPPALVITAEFDPVRDSGEAYAARLQDAGVRASLRRFDGTIHLFYLLGGVLEKGVEAFELGIESMRQELSV
jgi:acetyl esterase|tara:strand:+ start:999 stop:1919 length:921 start_codon:yes stop_codon:yes gene_type:complete